ncbi:MAG: diacylglycerol kinase family protein [Candidatus Sericytochromatia bacterium]
MLEKKALLIHNPTSGQIWTTYKPENAIDFLKEKGWKVDLIKTEYAGHAKELASKAIKDKYPVVISSGGDGTINEIIQGLAGSETLLGVLPVGTTNVLAKDLKIPSSYKKALEVINELNSEKIDLGLINDRYFVLMVGIGFDAKVMSEVDSNFKKIAGLVAVVTTSPISMINHKQAHTSITIWDKHGKKQKIKMPSYQLIVCNSSTYGNSIKVMKDSSIYDGLLDLIIFKSQNRYDFSRDLLTMAFFTKETFDEACEIIKASKVVIKTDPPMHVQVDGDSIGTTPVTIAIRHKFLNIIVPQSTNIN